jgi:hypothetical protein
MTGAPPVEIQTLIDAQVKGFNAQNDDLSLNVWRHGNHHRRHCMRSLDMHRSTSATLAVLSVGVALIGLAASNATAQPMAKAQVGGLITRVEKNVDEFRNYLEKRGENASDAKSTAQTSGRRKGQGATESQKAKANTKKDALDDALGDLNRSTNRLRRKFDATDKWIETKSQVESVVDDASKINEVVARGNYGAEAARVWGRFGPASMIWHVLMACSP